MERLYLYRLYHIVGYHDARNDETKTHLAGNREDWLSRLRDASRDHRDDLVNNHRKEGGEESGERVLGATVLGNLHDLGNDPADKVHPGHRRREGETGNDGVERLGLKLSRDKGDSIHSSVHNASHCVSFYTIHYEKKLFGE